MVTSTSEQTMHALEVTKDVQIAAPVEIVFETLLEQLGPRHETAPGSPLPMKLEPWPGGRWYRDLGNSAGHFWGHVQVIKPPTLLEICGPMFMSYPAANHVQYRLSAEGNGTRLKFMHKSFGLIPKDHLEGMQMGWNYKLKRISELAARRQ